VYLSLGSNLGDRLANLVAAVRALGVSERVVALSPVYETAPLGPDGTIVDDQPAFLNCVVAADTALGPAALRARTATIEAQLGREHRERWQSRPIDIDIVLFGDERIETPELIVPHPRIGERAFVMRPLLDLDPDVRVPGVGKLAPLLPAVAWQGVRRAVGADEFATLVGRMDLGDQSA
jgi:2-amino-4-hydroxy-6-hydroxymethyldihydropteridine diphosphokinase